ncbi:MAG: M3 family metallopeptidase [Planctomycetes bacterium]|nr:M3 family metallopeptidase [Planctomycetota bacterium]
MKRTCLRSRTIRFFLLSLVGIAGAIARGEPNLAREPMNPNDVSILLKTWPGPFGGVPPWDQVRPDAFIAAFDAAIEQAKREIDAIADESDPPTFANTFVAMENAGRALTRLENIFGVHTSNLNIDPIPDIERQVEPKLAAFRDSVVQNTKLFARMSAVHGALGTSDPTPAERRLVDERTRAFIRQGARLSAEDKAKLSAINQRLASLFTEFNQNVLAEEQGHVTWIEEKADLAGLPESIVGAMAAAAGERGKPGRWAVLNTRSSMEPFLTYADRRPLREQVWRNYYTRAEHGDEHDNRAIITEILQLRAERAKLLGYPTHAHWRLEPQMAKTPEATLALMLTVWPKAVARVREEVADMQRIADQSDPGVTIEPWDYRYYAEKVRKAKYDLDFNLVKPHLQLDKLRDAMMWAAGELYGFRFRRLADIPIFHPDVEVWEVVGRTGDHVGLWYFDPYARTGKRSGAWMTDYRVQERIDRPITPIVSNNSNFIKAGPGQPVLISWDDARTLFHEFGHALHGLCSNVRYPSQAGTNVARDFVEFPSQINEHWLSTPEVLNRFALHYETNKPLPAELVAKIERAATFNEGFATVEYLASALVDMKLHLAGDSITDPWAFERATLSEIGMPKEIVMRHRTPHFSHIFSSDGYSAGYYSYLWADALTADAANVFEDAGTYYDPAIAKRLYDHVMSVGDTVDPAEAFRAFRGRDVDTKALLRKRGFPTD